MSSILSSWLLTGWFIDIPPMVPVVCSMQCNLQAVVAKWGGIPNAEWFHTYSLH